MARFDVHRLAGTRPNYVLDIQADLLDHLATRVVVPLLPEATLVRVLPSLNPVFEVLDMRLVMVTQAIATVPRRALGPPVASLDAQNDAIIRAIDTLLSGV